MITHSEKQFRKWITTHGLMLDDRDPESAIPLFKSGPGHERFWCIPADPKCRSHFMLHMLKLMGKWSSCFAWRPQGCWPSRPDPGRTNDVTEYQILSGLGIPMGTTHVLEFGKSDLPSLVTLLFSTSVFGWCVLQDVCIVPDNAQYILEVNHHGVVYMSFRNDKRLKDYIHGMKRAKYFLPRELPDSTFSKPNWMRTGPRHDGR